MGGVEIGTTEVAEALCKNKIENFVASKGGRLVRELDKLKVKHFTLDLKTKNPFKIYTNSKKLEKIIKNNAYFVGTQEDYNTAFSNGLISEGMLIIITDDNEE